MLNLLAFLVLAAASPWDAPVTPQGVGPLRVGMSIAALHRIGAVQDRLSPEMEADDVCCGYWRLPGHPGLVAMMTGGLVVRIGARLYDTSLKSRLQRLQYAMKGAA